MNGICRKQATLNDYEDKDKGNNKIEKNKTLLIK